MIKEFFLFFAVSSLFPSHSLLHSFSFLFPFTLYPLSIFLYQTTPYTFQWHPHYLGNQGKMLNSSAVCLQVPFMILYYNLGATFKIRPILKVSNHQRDLFFVFDFVFYCDFCNASHGKFEYFQIKNNKFYYLLF